MFVILYGFGTPTAFVRSVATTREEAEKKLAATRRTWRAHASRFTLHDYDEVVSRSTPNAWILKPGAVIRHGAEEPWRAPSTVDEERARARAEAIRRGHSLLEAAE